MYVFLENFDWNRRMIWTGAETLSVVVVMPRYDLHLSAGAHGNASHKIVK